MKLNLLTHKFNHIWIKGEGINKKNRLIISSGFKNSPLI